MSVPEQPDLRERIARAIWQAGNTAETAERNTRRFDLLKADGRMPHAETADAVLAVVAAELLRLTQERDDARAAGEVSRRSYDDVVAELSDLELQDKSLLLSQRDEAEALHKDTQARLARAVAEARLARAVVVQAQNQTFRVSRKLTEARAEIARLKEQTT